MAHLLTFSPGWDLPIPAGTMLIRLDIAFKSRPGPGGFAIILEASDLEETILLRGCVPDTITDELIHEALANLATEVGENRALILTRSPSIAERLGEELKPYRMLRILGNHPLAVADATRHAAIMAERASYTQKGEVERYTFSRKVHPDHHGEIHDAAPMIKALQTLVRTVKPESLDDLKVAQTSENLLKAAEESRLRRLARKIKSIVRDDMPKPTKAQ